MASAHFSRDHVWVVITSIASLGSIPYAKLTTLGINGIYLSAQDDLATKAKRTEVVKAGFAAGLFYPGNSVHMDGAQPLGAWMRPLRPLAARIVVRRRSCWILSHLTGQVLSGGASCRNGEPCARVVSPT